MLLQHIHITNNVSWGTTQKMEAQITLLLESTNPQDRKQAIRALAKMGGQEALRTLAGVYKYDEDPDLRELAIQAGKYIKKQTTAESTLPPAANAAPSYYRYAPEVEEAVEDEPEPEVEEEIKSVVVSAGKLQQAKGLLDRALDMSMKGEDDKALDSLVKAFKTNPNYRLDTYAMSIAYNITGMDKQEMLALVSDDTRLRTMKNDAKQKVSKEKAKRREESGEVTWDTVALDIVLYYIIIAGLLMVGLLLMVQINRAGVTAASQPCPTCSAADHARLAAFVKMSNIDDWKSITPVQGILYGLASGLGFVLYLIVLLWGSAYGRPCAVESGWELSRRSSFGSACDHDHIWSGSRPVYHRGTRHHAREF